MFLCKLVGGSLGTWISTWMNAVYAMSFLDSLDKDGRDLVVSLPYRVGLWVSHADQTGGSDAGDEELKALENIMDAFTREVFGSEIVQIVMSETVARKVDWNGSWKNAISSVPAECQRVMSVLNEVGMDEKEVGAYKQRLIEIAEAVALAFREYDQLSFMQKLRVYLLFYKERYKALKKGLGFMEMDQFICISLEERRALYKLADILDVPYA
jgi:hypothetical protein